MAISSDAHSVDPHDLDPDEAKLVELNARYGSDWYCWRSQTYWNATYKAAPGELGQTLVRDTADELETALGKVKTGPRPELEPALGDDWVA